MNPTRTETLLQRVLARGEAKLRAIDALLDDPDCFDDDFIGEDREEADEPEEEVEVDHP